MISPTGKSVRSDSEGSGEYGASRGNRVHNGIDYLCDEGQAIRAPFDLKIVRLSKPKSGSSLSGIVWQSGKTTGKMFYFDPDNALIGRDVKQSQIIGVAQSVSKCYGLPDMLDHIHFQIDN